MRRARVEFQQDSETIWSKRFIANDDLPAFLKQAFRIPDDALADRWLDVRWNAPALMALWSGAVASGRPKEEGIIVPSAHFFTPETTASTHYFYAISFPRVLGPIAEDLAASNVEALRGPFECEDKPVIEAVARRMAGAPFWSLKPVLLTNDTPSIRARRLVEQKIQKENQMNSLAG